MDPDRETQKQTPAVRIPKNLALMQKIKICAYVGLSLPVEKFPKNRLICLGTKKRSIFDHFSMCLFPTFIISFIHAYRIMYNKLYKAKS